MSETEKKQAAERRKVIVAAMKLRRAAFKFARHEPAQDDDNDTAGQRLNRELLRAACAYAEAVTR